MRPSRSSSSSKTGRCGWARRLGNRMRAESGSAAVEFITAGVILLVPLVYLIVAVSSIQAGALAVEGAARQAARVYVLAPTEAEANERAERAVLFALSDLGVDTAGAGVAVNCSGVSGSCLQRGAIVTVSVQVQIPLPLVPAFLDFDQTASVPLEASASQTVSRFWGAEK